MFGPTSSRLASSGKYFPFRQVQNRVSTNQNEISFYFLIGHPRKKNRIWSDSTMAILARASIGQWQFQLYHMGRHKWRIQTYRSRSVGKQQMPRLDKQSFK